jgi:hypothetical protein
MNTPSSADGFVNSKCIECGADISSKAKFCEECGALQTASPTSSSDQVGKALPESTANGIESPTATTPRILSTVTDNSSNPSEAGSVDEGAPKQRVIFIFLGLAAVAGAIVLACIVWFHSHPISPKAQYDLGLKYAIGDGVQRDDAEAVVWFQKAAEQGNKESQYNLGVMYEHGEGGLSKDDAQAVFWYQKAAEQGYAEANVAIANVHARQQQEQQEQARMEAQERQEQARMEALMGTPVDFASLYVMANATGMEIGKRYNVQAVWIQNSDPNSISLYANEVGSGSDISGHWDFDDSN